MRSRQATQGVVLSGILAVLGGCAITPGPSNFGEIYNEAAQKIGSDRNPVLVIPGILGSKLEQEGTQRPVWGRFIYGAANADTAEGARLVALPMGLNQPLSELRDEIVPTDVLDTLELDIALVRGLEFEAYAEILRVLAAGKYRDQSLGESGAIDYGGQHYTCFQYAYDWRRDISEQAVVLHERVLAAIDAQPTGGSSKVDVVAHSMGGLVLRYYLRYGPNPLPEDGSLPELSWAGAKYVENAIIIGTPNAGSVKSLQQLVLGVNFAALITPTYRPAVLGTMPAIYQLLPRPRHARVVSENDEPIDHLQIETWERFGWGLLNPDQDVILQQLLPEVPSAEERLAIARDHLDKCLNRTRQLFAALDRPAIPPVNCRLFLIAGDAQPTSDVLAVDADGSVSDRNVGPGDGTVTRVSALMDERVGGGYKPRLQSPVSWSSVRFLESDHIGLTRDPLFTNFVLWVLLERPRGV